MNKHKIEMSDLLPIDVWVTTNVAVFHQEALFSTRNKLYQFVPTTPKGYVIITAANEKMYCRQLQGYALHRPASITISWLTDKTLNFRELRLIEGIIWHTNRQGQWKTVGEYRPETDDWEKSFF